MPPHPKYVVYWALFLFFSLHYSTFAVMEGFFITSSTHSRHSSHTVSTAHASRTHVKPPQTDFLVKPDNSLGPTHDSPSESPLRTKATSNPKQHRKSIKNDKQREHHPSQALTNSPPCYDRSSVVAGARRAASKTKPVSSSVLRAMEGAWKASRESHGSLPRSSKPSRLDIGDWFRFLSLWKERLSLSFSLFRVSTRVSP